MKAPEEAPLDQAAPSSFSGESFCPAARRRLILWAAILASSMAFIDGSVVSIALPAMRDSLDASLVQAQWFSNAYMLFLTSLILLGGALGDKYGTARIFRLGIIGFVIASLACAFAPTAESLIVFRAAKGLGAAFMIPGSLAILSRAYPPDLRGKAIGTWAGASALTTALGPIIGGFALSAGGPELWRWIFAINLPFGVIALWLLLRAVSEDSTEDTAPLDWVGAGLVTIGLGALAWGLSAVQSGDSGGLWIAVGCATLVSFVLWEARTPHPMMPPSLFKNPTFAAANGATFLLYAALGLVMFFLPLALIGAWGLPEIYMAGAFAPLSVFISTLSAPVGRLADRIGAGSLIAVGAGLVAVSYAALGLLMGLQSFWYSVLPPMIVMGLGMAFVVAPLSTAVMGSIDDTQSGTASGVNNALARGASLFAVALGGLIVSAIYDGPLSFGETGGDAVHIAATNVAFMWVAWVAAALAGVSAMLSAIFIRRT